MSSWGAEGPSNNLVERTGPERPTAHEARSPHGKRWGRGTIVYTLIRCAWIGTRQRQGVFVIIV
jgi:hypothetical protein